MADRIYPTELQLNRANASDTEAPFMDFMDLNLCISYGTVSTKIYDKRNDFDFDIVIPLFWMAMSTPPPHPPPPPPPRRISYGVYISQLIRFTRSSSNLSDFICRNKAIPAKPLTQGYRYFNLRRAFSNFYRRHSASVVKYSICLKTLLQQGISKPELLR